MAKTRRSLTAKTFIITALLVSGFLFAINPSSPSVKADPNNALSKDKMTVNSNPTGVQIIKGGDYVTYNVTVGGDAGTQRFDFLNVTDSLVEVQITSTIWYFPTFTHTHDYNYVNGQIIIADLTCNSTEPNKIGEARIPTAYGLKDTSIFSYWESGLQSNVLRTYYVPNGCQIFFKYYANDSDGNHVVRTLAQTNIEWLKNIGQPIDLSSFPPSDGLLGAATYWAGHYGSRALYVDFYDNYLAHHDTDGSSWGPWPNVTGMWNSTVSINELLNQTGFEVIRAADIPANLSAFDVVIIDAYWACEPTQVPMIRSYLHNGGGLVFLASVADYFRCYCKDWWTWSLPTDPLSINNSQWLGVNGFTSSGGTATITVNHPFNTDFVNGDIILQSSDFSLSTAYGGNPNIVAEWGPGQIFAYGNEFGNGRLYYQAAVETMKVIIPQGMYTGNLVTEFGYGIPSALLTIDSSSEHQCDANGHFNVSLSPGFHNVTFSADWFDPQSAQVTIVDNQILSAGTIQLSINNSAMNLVHFTDSKGQTLLIPNGWVHSEGFEANGMKADLMLNGTVFNGLTTNIIISSGIDSTVQGSTVYLWSMINSTISGLQGQGLTASLSQNPVFKTINNHTGIVFSLHYSNSLQTQKFAFIVDENNHYFWMIICTISDQKYVQYQPMFDQMIMSFTASEPTLADLNNIWLIVGAAIIFGALVIVLIVAVIRRPHGKERNSAPAIQPSSSLKQQANWYCMSCGTQNQSGWAYCSRCGSRKM